MSHANATQVSLALRAAHHSAADRSGGRNFPRRHACGFFVYQDRDAVVVEYRCGADPIHPGVDHAAGIRALAVTLEQAGYTTETVGQGQGLLVHRTVGRPKIPAGPSSPSSPSP